MLLAIAFTIWVVVSAAAHRVLSKTRMPAIPTMACATAIGLSAVGLANLLQVWLMPVTQISGDTYYVVSKGQYWVKMAIFYLAVAAVALLIQTFARGWPKRLLAPMFWIFHLGAGAVILPRLLASHMISKRYVDYPDTLYWESIMSLTGEQVGFLGAACLLLLSLIALGQALLRRRRR